jgi:S1-C subfamily serine protease
LWQNLKKCKVKCEEVFLHLFNRIGATFAPLTEDMKERFNLHSGVLVTRVFENGFYDQAGILPGLIIAFINSSHINYPQDIDRALLSAQSGKVQIFAIAPDRSKVVFNFSPGT